MTKSVINSIPETVLRPAQEFQPFDVMKIMSVIAATTGLLFLLAPHTGLPVRILLTAFILLTLKYWGSVIVLMAVQMDLFLREPPRSETFRGLNGVLTVALIVALLMFINRQRDLLYRAAGSPISSILKRIAAFLRGDTAHTPGRGVREMFAIAKATLRSIFVLTVSVTVARTLLRVLPTRRTLNSDLQTWLIGNSSVLQASLVLGAVIAGWVVFNEISWRQLTREQAGLYVRSVFLKIHHADLRMIIAARLKQRQKSIRRAAHGKTPPGILNQKNFAGNEQ
ncbi:MAG: hypothetical protein R3C17_13545 [Planctomycetaceae bacterium]